MKRKKVRKPNDNVIINNKPMNIFFLIKSMIIIYTVHQIIMNNCFIILAGGESKRFNSKIPKPYHLYKGKPLLLHSIDKVKGYKKINKIVLVINKKHKSYIKKLKIKNIEIIKTGETRSESAYKGLKSIKNYNVKNVMIHDAARPNFSLKLLDTQTKFNIK